MCRMQQTLKKLLFLALIVALTLGTANPAAADYDSSISADTGNNYAAPDDVSPAGLNKITVFDNPLVKLNAQIGKKLKDDERAKFMIILKDPIDMPPEQRVGEDAMEKFMTACDAEIDGFSDLMRRKNIRAEIVGRYNLLFCGIAVNVTYEDAKKIAVLPQVKSIEYCVSYGPPKADVRTLRLIRDIDSNKLIKLHETDSKYKGAGKIVAVIDSGFDYEHPAMRISDDTVPKIQDKDSMENLMTSKGINYGVYLSEKMPFAYNYASGDNNIKEYDGTSHGMHVAGIVGANAETPSSNGDIVKGVAPECQIYAMRVFAGGGSTAPDIYIRAMEDAVKLGADSINMSLGSPLGSFEVLQEKESGTLTALESARRMGIVVAMAAGNEGASGGSIMPTVYAPDYGLVDAPAVAPLSLSVASCNNTHISSKVMEVKAYSKKIAYRKGTGPAFDDPEAPMKDFIEIVDCGYGSPEEVAESAANADGGLYGKIALIQRGGDLTFGQKVYNANKKGAAGVIIYNNAEGGNELVSMQVSNPYPVIPSVFIGHDDGKFLLSIAENGDVPKIRIGSEFVKVPNPQGGELSKFSSWGLSVEGDLKPEILAPGGNIFSTINKGNYISMSGTSMATPHVAGAVALMSERAAELGKDNESKYAFIKNMLMSTAEPITDSDGVPISPRGQGAGLMNLAAATKSQVYVAGSDGRSAAMCGDVDDSFEFELTLINLDQDNSHKFTYSTVLMTDKVADGRYTLENELLKQIPGGTVEVPAGGELSVGISVDASEFTDRQNKLQPQGYYLEGFTRFESIDGGSNLSVPFVAFKGKWKELPAIEDSIYNLSDAGLKPMYYDENGEHADFTHFTTPVQGKAVVCGAYKDENGEIKYDRNRIAFSPNDDNRGDEFRLIGTFTRCYRVVKFAVYELHDTLREHPLALAYSTDGGLKNFNNGADFTSLRSHTEYDWEWSDSAAAEGVYDVVVQVGPVTKPQALTTLNHRVIVDKTEPKIEKATYDSASRKFTIEKTSDKKADKTADGSGINYIELSYEKNGEIVTIDPDAGSPKNQGSTWVDGKHWTIPADVNLENVKIEVIDFAYNRLKTDAKKATETPSNPPGGGSSGGSGGSSGSGGSGGSSGSGGSGGSSGSGGSGGSSGGGASGGETSNPADKPIVEPNANSDTAKTQKFTDVSKTHWANTAINYVAEKGIFKGTSEDKFSPSGKMNRAMFVTALARYLKAETSAAVNMKDVPADAYYAKAVAWGIENKIIKGISENEFAPLNNITREQVAAILYRAMLADNIELKNAAEKAEAGKKAENESAAKFADAESIAPYAQESVAKLVSMGIFTGRDGNLFSPKETLTRAEAAAIFHRLDTVLTK